MSCPDDIIPWWNLINRSVLEPIVKRLPELKSGKLKETHEIPPCKNLDTSGYNLDTIGYTGLGTGRGAAVVR
jgi:hypothetical protein